MTKKRYKEVKVWVIVDRNGEIGMDTFNEPVVFHTPGSAERHAEPWEYVRPARLIVDMQGKG